MSLANVDTWRDLIYQSEIGTKGKTANSDWIDPYFVGSYDDAGWVVLLFIRIRDYLGSGDANFANFDVRQCRIRPERFLNNFPDQCNSGL